MKENNVNEESAIVQDNLPGWTCNTTNSRGKPFLPSRIIDYYLFDMIFFFTEENSPMPPSSVSSGFSDDDSLRCDSSQSVNINQFVDYIVKKKRAGLIREYDEIKNRSPDGTFNNARYLILMFFSIIIYLLLITFLFLGFDQIC